MRGAAIRPFVLLGALAGAGPGEGYFHLGELMQRIRIVCMARSVAAVGLAAALAALTGCQDSNKSTVTGKVTYKGAPVTGGQITLTPKTANGAAPAIPIKPDGTFSVSDIPPGDYGVAVSTDGVPDAAPAGGTSRSPVPEGAAQGTKVVIPDKFKNAQSSGITWTVKGGKQDLPIDLDKY